MNRQSGLMTSFTSWAHGRLPFLFLCLSSLLLPESALALSTHPSCHWDGYQTVCSNPSPPPQPTFSENPSLDGSYEVRIYNSDPYSWLVWNTGATSPGSFSDLTARLNVPNASTGNYGYSAKRCIYTGSQNICSGYSPGAGIVVVRTPNAPATPTVTASTADVCNSRLTVTWPAGSGYSDDAIVYYNLYEDKPGTSEDGIRIRKPRSWEISDAQELATYSYKVNTYYYGLGERSNDSPWSGTRTITTPQCPPNTPAAPMLSQPNLDSTNLSIDWQDPGSQRGSVRDYTVARTATPADEDSWSTLGGNCATSNTGCTDGSSLLRGQTYYYRVRANRSQTSSGWSQPAFIKLKWDEPPLPSTPTFTNVAPYGYTVNWNPVGGGGTTGTVTYHLGEKIGGGAWTWTNVGGVTSKPYSDRTPATLYQHSVKACNPDGLCVDPSDDPAKIASISFPGQPGTLLISVIPNTFGREYTVSWGAAAAASGDPVTSYRLEQSVNGDGFTDIYSGGLSHTLPPQSPDTTMAYQVRASNARADGVYRDGLSYWVPQSPSSVSVSVTGQGSSNPGIIVSWPSQTPTAQYRLQESFNGGQSWGADIVKTGISHQPASVMLGTDYRYRVASCNAQGACSPYTQSAVTRVQYPEPAPPGNLSVSLVNAETGTVALSWTPPAGTVANYQVRYRGDNGQTWSVPQTVPVSPKSYSGLTGGLTYYFEVSACNVDGCGDPAQSGAFNLPPPPPVLGVLDQQQNCAASVSGTFATDYAGEYTLCWANVGGQVETVTAFLVTEDANGNDVLTPVSPEQANPSPASLHTRFVNQPPNYGNSPVLYAYRAEACNDGNCNATDFTVSVSYYPLPGQPANLHISQGPTPAGDYTLEWSRPDGSDQVVVHFYQIDIVHEADLDANGIDTETAPDCGISPEIPADCRIPHVDGQPHTLAFTGGQPGQTLRYRVRACFADEDGCDVYTDPLTVYIPHTPPVALTHDNLIAETGSYTLTWTPPAGAAVDRYRLDVSEDNGQTWNEPAIEIADPYYDVSGHANGAELTYRVQACNADGDCGDYSVNHPVYVPYLKPGLPDELRIDSLDPAGSSIVLAWTPPADAAAAPVEHYRVQRSSDGVVWESPVEIASPAITVTELANGATHYFRVAACNRDVCHEATPAEYGPPISQYLRYIAPGIPGALSHAASDNNPAAGTFTVHWIGPVTVDGAIAPLTHYQIEYSLNGGGNWQSAPTADPTPGRVTIPAGSEPFAPAATLAGLATGAAYSVRVLACNDDACSAPTEPYQVYLPHPTPGIPAFQATIIDPASEAYAQRRFTVLWTPPATGSVHHYQLQQYAGVIQAIENWPDVVASTQATAYTFTDRAYGESYRYRLRACSEPASNPETCSSWAETTVRLKYPTPNEPSGVVVSNIDFASGAYTLTWNGVLGWAPQYTYQLQQAPAGTPAVSTAWTAPTGNSGTWLEVEQTGYLITNQPPGDYAHRVRACNPEPDNDCGDWSPAADVTVLATPASPSSIAVEAGSCRFHIGWTPPPGTGEYRYELAQRVGSGDWNSLVWTGGTSHDMILSEDTDDGNYAFRVRVRALSNGFYSAWSNWRTAAAVPAQSCDDRNVANNSASLTAPPYSETGQYEVTMKALSTGMNERREHLVLTNGSGDWSTLTGGSFASENSYTVFTKQYASSNAQPTGEYAYQFRFCADPGVNTEAEGCYSRNPPENIVVETGTTVLRDPGSVGPLQLANSPSLINGAYQLADGGFTLNWSAAPNSGLATQYYEIQTKQADTNDWIVLPYESGTSLSGSVPEFGIPFDYRVRACVSYGGYVNCGSWAVLNAPLVQTVGAPRFAVNTYPADGELVIYDRRVPVQWLPPWNMAEEGDLHHYQISVNAGKPGEDGQTYWTGPERTTNVAPVTGSNANPPVQQALIEVEQSGQKEFLIRACGSSGPESCGDALRFEITVIVPPEAPTPSGIVGQADPDYAVGGQFDGVLSGEFSVQPSGAVAYSLPIAVPPGTAGMQPEISLNYSSQAGNGIAGQGWSVGGLSTISRCGQTLAQDGRIHGVDYSEDDAWCLDGQRLIEIADNEYRLERNDFSRVERLSGGVCGTWFRVKTPFGRTLEYGNTGDACFNAGKVNGSDTVVHGWALNKATDLSGNYIRYKYAEYPGADGNEFVIDRIEYTGNDNKPSQPYMAMVFQYDDSRPDAASAYRAGIRFNQTRRLTRIITGVAAGDLSQNPDGYGTYTLNYAPDNSDEPATRLESIGYCATASINGAPETQCLEPLELEWSPYEAGWVTLPNAYKPPLPFITEDGKDRGARLIDLDADGLPDLLYAAQNHGRVAYHNTGSGWQSWGSFIPPVDFLNHEYEDCGVRFADLTGDGRPDLLTSVPTGYGDGYQAYKNMPDGWETMGAHPTRFHNGYCDDNGARIADLNGDGLADLLLGTHVNPASWHNTGQSVPRWGDWYEVDSYYSPSAFVRKRVDVTRWRPHHAPSNWDDGALEPTAWLVDLNGDGLLDVLRKDTPHLIAPDLETSEIIQYHGRLNTGKSWVTNDNYNVQGYINYYELPDGGTRFGDFNGDGLPDLMRGNTSYDLIKLNTGDGWIDAPFTRTPRFIYLATSSATAQTSVHLLDVNADGRSDVLVGRGAWLATESGWNEDYRYAFPVDFSDPKKAGGVQFADVNGDGRLDLLYADASSKSAWTTRATQPQLVAVTDGLGNTVQVRYQALTDPSQDGRAHPLYARTERTLDTTRQLEANIPIPVVSRVTAGDGIGGELTTEYAYKGLIVGTGGRGMQGFEQMIAYKPDNTVVTTSYRQAFPYSGMPSELVVTYGDGGPVIRQSSFEYCYAVTSAANDGHADNPESPAFTSASGQCGDYDDGGRSNESIYVFADRSTEINNLLSDDLTAVVAGIRVETDNTMGRYGYPTQSTVTTTGDSKTYTTETVHDYDDTLADGEWLGRIARTTVTRGTPAGSSIRTSEYEYDPGTTLLVKEIIEPNAAPDDTLTQAIAYAHDPYGNVTETTVCAATIESCTANPSLPNQDVNGRSVTTIYDNRGRFPIENINALDESETREFAHPLGLETLHTGPNNIDTAWEYDPLGRKKSETSPFGTTTWEYHRATQGFAPGAQYRVQKNESTGELDRVYYDARGRERRKLSRNLHGEWVAADTVYDRHGRVTAASEPYFVHDTNAGDRYWTEHEYDGLGRQQMSRVPLGDYHDDLPGDGVAETTTYYNGFETISTGAKGRRTLEQTNALGQTVRRVDDEGGLGVAVEYEYDSQGNLQTTQVDGDPATMVTIGYDLRGRKISMDDPDMGEWQYEYNGYGELVKQVDNKGQITLIQYDKLGRMTARADDAVAGDPDVDLSGEPRLSEWTYYPSTAAAGSRGKLAYEKGPNETSKTYFYTDRGLPSQINDAIGPDGVSLRSFSVQYGYDEFGRSQYITYPRTDTGGKVLTVENRYSPYGGLWYVVDTGDVFSDESDDRVYWIAEMVDARGQIMQETLRNQNSINRDYNHATGWLRKIESWDLNTDMIQQTRFGFDMAGNMLYRERFRPWIVNPDGSYYAADTEAVREDFTYDSLDRLTGATVSRDGVPQQSLQYGYDRLGNFIYKDADTPGNRYQYNQCGAGPHAVCTAQGSTYSYDANGNMTASSGAKARTLEYSAFNKPVRLIENDATVEFTYGADRSRVYKQASQPGKPAESTWYVGLGGEGNPLYELNERLVGGNVVREHLYFIYAGGYHGGQAFAVHIEADSNGDGVLDDPDTRYYHRDHLGSVIAVTDESGLVNDASGTPRAQLMSYDAFGKRRNADWSLLSEGDASVVDQYSEGSPGNLDYTGHEAIPEVGLIHMNGRVYDPELGRFVSADPNVQFAKASQSYNRYSYVLNNPIRYNDPSGYMVGESFFQSISPKQAQVITVALNFVPYCQYWCSALFNAQWTYANTRDMGEATFAGMVGVVSSAAGGAAGAAGSAFGGAYTAAAISGAASGAVYGGLYANRYGGNVSRAMVQGAARGAATAVVMVGIQQAVSGESQPEGVNVEEIGGYSIKGDKQDTYHGELDHMVKEGPNGEAIIEGTVSISGAEGTAEGRAVMIDKANGTHIAKSRCFFWFCGKDPEQKLIVNLSEHNGPGRGDIHIVSRDEMAYRDGTFDVAFRSSRTCSNACADHTFGYIHIGSRSMGSIQYIHEVFHVLGFRHRSAGLMHPNATRMYSKDVEMLRQSYLQ